MKRLLLDKTREAILSVLPITAIVLILNYTILHLPFYTILLFIFGSILLIFGMAFFTLGADTSMMVMGEKIGSYLTRSRKLPLVIITTFIIGVFITIAEPDLKVLARQTPAVPDMTLIFAVAIGVGVFLVISFLRILLQIKLSRLFIIFYALTFLLATLTDTNFLPVAFDSGGVTTGPITVPFIMALGIGLAMVRGDKAAEEDSFGLVALCSIGPIMTVLILGIFYKPTGSYIPITVPEVNSFFEVVKVFLKALPGYFEEVFIALIPIVLFFVIFQIFALRLKKRQLLKISVGVIYTFIGLLLFLTGVNVGFMPIGFLIGKKIVESPFRFILILLGIVIGYFIVAAEPAVHVLKQQVEDITDGSITGRSLGLSLSIGVGVSVGLAMLRVVTGISIWYMILPGYLLALILTYFVPPIFTAIAFDSGGVASGPMTATFLVPFAMGATEAVGGNIQTDAFGIVAMVAMTPLITIQCLGLFYRFKSKRASIKDDSTLIEDTIIDFDEQEHDQVDSELSSELMAEAQNQAHSSISDDLTIRQEAQVNS